MNVWVTSILTAPFILIVVIALREGYWNAGFISLYILSVFVTVLFSLPSVFLYKLAFIELVANKNSALLVKTLLAIISLSTLSFSYLVMEKFTNSGYEADTIIPLISLIGSVIISGFIFNIKSDKKI